MSEGHVIYLSEYKFFAVAAEISTVRERFVEFLLSLGLDDLEKEGWKLSFTEAVNNAIEHGSQNNPEKIVWVRWWSTDHSIWLETQDGGQGPDPARCVDPQLPEDPLAEGGRGLFIIHHFADDFVHWRSSHGYIARIAKKYERLNNVMPQNAEMDAILDELSDCYESLSLYDRLAENLIEDERVDHFVASSLEIFLDSRDYDRVSIEIMDAEQSEVYRWITTIEGYASLGILNEGLWSTLEDQESLIWSDAERSVLSAGLSYGAGACVPIFVNDQVVGLIAAGYTDSVNKILSNDIRNLRALADIIGVSISRAVLQKERDERKRLWTEINIATKLQHELLPVAQKPPEVTGFDVFIESISALEIAGDFVELRKTSSGEYVGCVIDVMGKGVSAAILAGIFRSQFIAFCERGGKLSTFLEVTNKSLEMQLGDATMFITTFVFKLNTVSNELSYANAGHPPGLLLRQSGGLEELISHGPPIGLFGDLEYAEGSVELMPGDQLIVVTDGLYEWSTTEEDIFGWQPMVDAFDQKRDIGGIAAWRDLYRNIRVHRDRLRIEQEDDETILILTRDK